jgi:FKBP-type peptidyl-prolyl cis-trans isomerase SlyD
MLITDNCVVSIHYKLTNDAGEQIDSSAGLEPLAYLQGSSGVIRGLQTALTGRAVGERLQVTVQPEDGYGEIKAEAIQTVPSSAFEGVDGLKPGMTFQARSPEGQLHRVSVLDVSDDGVRIDGNHPLAGEVLHFEVTIESIRHATEDEITHGHAH